MPGPEALLRCRTLFLNGEMMKVMITEGFKGTPPQLTSLDDLAPARRADRGNPDGRIWPRRGPIVLALVLQKAGLTWYFHSYNLVHDSHFYTPTPQ